jgi:NAD(P)-dependent dehydrogenase (short-subunit alcohol dehydrogenase family)
VTDADACARAVGELDRLDVLANIHGIGSFTATRDVTLDEWRRVLDVNLTGTFLTCQAALDALVASKGAIVNMASLAGLMGTPYNAAYCASKGGVVMLTKSLAVELASSGVRVNCVCPSAVATNFLANFEIPDGADVSLFTRSAPLNGRMATPEEVAAAVAYLASDDAAMVTGVALPVDGGALA